MGEKQEGVIPGIDPCEEPPPDTSEPTPPEPSTPEPESLPPIEEPPLIGCRLVAYDNELNVKWLSMPFMEDCGGHVPCTCRFGR